jgi:hypothetical protein
VSARLGQAIGKTVRSFAFLLAEAGWTLLALVDHWPCMPCSTAVAGPPSLDKQGAAGFAGRKLAPGNAARLVGSTWLGKQQVGPTAC